MTAGSLSVRVAARDQGDALAVLAPSEGVSLRYGELRMRVAAMWAALRRGGCLGANVRVAVRTGNSVDTLVLLLALNESGTPFVPLHPRLTDAEAAALMADAQTERCIREAELAELARQTPGARDLADFAALPSVPDDRLLAILYTSGTSGQPKGAQLRASAFVASAAASQRNLGWQPDDRWLLCLPLCHVGGLSIVTRCLLARRAIVLLPRPDVPAIWTAIADGRSTLLSVVPTLLSRLLADDRQRLLCGLRVVLSGGAATPQPLYEQALAQGVPVLRTYGLTEACSQVTVGSYAQARQPQPGSGRPLDGVELVILPESDEPSPSEDLRPARVRARALPAGQPGRICLRGPTLMQGYLHRPPLAGHFFDTGDIGYVEPGAATDVRAGALHVLSRRTDLIVTGGENVYPAEVEAALLSHPAVAAALVFGVDDPLWGAKVAAALVPHPDAMATDRATDRATDWATEGQAIADHLATRLAAFKRPRLVCWVRSLPELANGKPDRRGAARDLAGQLIPLPSPRVLR